MRIPIATYRIQFNPDFGFREAKQIAPYLDALGISDIYASPIFKARTGSMHGYDVVDQNQLNPELGDQAEFDALISDLHERGMGWLQDIVPNHMAYDGQNHYLMDVLEHGPHSQYFDYFDIEWDHSDDIHGKLLAPMLGDFYDRCLERGEIQLSYDKDGLKVNYYSLQFPLRIESYAQFLTHDLNWLRRRLGRQHPDYIKLLGILYLLKDTFPEMALQQRKDQSAFVKQMLWELYQDNQEVKAFIDQNIETFNGQPGKPGSFTLLDSLLLEQFYRLSFWKVGAEELNYRRFFTVNELICLKIDSPKVLKNTHKLIFQLVDSGAFDGLRIDHIDGLYDPTTYLKRLRERKDDLYIVIEKILEVEEELPSYWPVQGTSGYEFLNYANGIFCQQQNRKAFSQFYRRFSGVTTPYDQLFLEKKQLIADTNLVGDIDNLARFLKKVASQYRYGRDLTASGLKTAIQEVLVTFPIYCTYINQRGVSQRDLRYIRTAIQTARKRIPQLLNELNLIERFLLLEYEDSLPEDERAQWLHFVMRLQQFTGPLMAKGVEDTLFYVYNRFISLNEVGGSPDHFGVSLMEFHEYNQRQHENWPYTLNATSTHDTKRSEDVRARLNVLSELPTEWRSQVKTWSEFNQPHKQSLSGHLVPDPNDEYFLYQTLVGAFPFDPSELESFKQRVKDYVVKAVREAKVYTAWLRPDTEYEDGFVNFVEALLTPSAENSFLEQLQTFQQKIADYGIYNALSQTLMKLVAPGIPDFYQGTEMWDLSLVDPDNRRPVDYDQRLTALKGIQKDWQTDKEKLTKDLLSSRTDGRIKLFLTMRGLALRNQFRQVLQNGSYAPIKTVGKYSENLVTFARHKGERTIVAIAPRFLTELIQPGDYPLGAKIWNDTQIELPGGAEASWCEWITDRTIAADNVISVGEVLRHFPVALLVSENHPVDL